MPSFASKRITEGRCMTWGKSGVLPPMQLSCRNSSLREFIHKAFHCSIHEWTESKIWKMNTASLFVYANASCPAGTMGQLMDSIQCTLKQEQESIDGWSREHQARVYGSFARVNSIYGLEKAKSSPDNLHLIRGAPCLVKGKLWSKCCFEAALLFSD